MLLQQHPVAMNAVRDTRVRGVGGLIYDILFPLDAPLVSMFTSTVENLDGGEASPTPATTAAPRPTFASAFGGALGETTGKFLVYAVIIGGALWYLNKHRPK